MIRSHRARAITVVAAVVAAAAIGLYYAWLADLPDPAQPLARSAASSSFITDRDGRVLYEIIDPQGSKQTALPLAEIPLACQQATVATEDRHFYQHPGVDPLAILRAAWQNWREGTTVSGGSTLTQQLAKNLFLAEDERVERSLRRKLREAWLAWRMERIFDKDEILALYLNTTYYGHFAVGIEAAAQAYFGVHASELDLAQCALLAGLPQYPAGYNPIENPEAARYRQHIVLGLMVEAGYLSSTAADGAGKEEMAYAASPFPIEAPHFVMWVQGQLETLLGAERPRAGGLKVMTTLDLDWQRQAEAIVRRRLQQLRPCAAGFAPGACDPDASPARRVDDAAVVALDPADGAVRALVGSADYFDPSIDGAVNAALSLRQPGSAIKPLTYAVALDPARAAQAGRAPWTAATLIADFRTAFPTKEGRPYIPQNYDMRYHGPVTVRTALANSYNIPAVKALQYAGVDALIDQAGRMGIAWQNRAMSSVSQPAEASTPAESDFGSVAAGSGGFSGSPSSTPPAEASTRDAGKPGASSALGYGLALTLGGAEVRLLDLTAAYASLASAGERVTPYAITRVEAADGAVLFEAPAAGGPNSSTPARRQALDPRVAYLITSVLSDDNARLPAFGGGNVLAIGRPAAAKTGTTTDWRDNWTMGYTPDLAVGVWVGNPDNTPMLDISGITGAGPIWHDFMTSVLRDTPVRQFERPDGLVEVEVCGDSGLRAGEGLASPPPLGEGKGRGVVQAVPIPCPNRRIELFIAGTEPQDVDQEHRQWTIDARTRTLADAGTPPEYQVTETYWVLPSEYAAWARENGFAQPPADWVQAAARSQVRESTTQDGAAAGLVLTSPDDNQSYRIDPAIPASAQQLPVTVRAGVEIEPGAQVTLLVDGEPLATLAAPNYTAWWQLSPGEHRFEATVVTNGGNLVRSNIVRVSVN